MNVKELIKCLEVAACLRPTGLDTEVLLIASQDYTCRAITKVEYDPEGLSETALVIH